MIAVLSPHGTRVSTLPLHSVLLQTGMEVTQPKPYQSAKEDVKRNPAHHYASPQKITTTTLYKAKSTSLFPIVTTSLSAPEVKKFVPSGCYEVT